ncbi:MAG: bifunctional 2-polyprenyl-6-hydroxyphenol methylase/3-demethylubiquinol 3-O-methyltransferase UbiG [Candidatus Competibacterales bacterium]
MTDSDVQAPSVDRAEVDHFRALADRWWDPKGPFWPLHTLNHLRVAYIRRQLCALFDRDPTAEAPLTDLQMLDIGCGGGILSEAMARLGAVVTGIDVVERNIHIAKLHAEASGLAIDYQTQSAEALAAMGRNYDVVLNMEVVEHVADLEGFMAACNRLVAPGGAMVVATINRTPLAWLTAIVGAEYILGWLPKGTHQYSKLVKPDQLKALLAQDGFEISAETGVWVNPLRRTMHLVGYQGVNYMLLARKP